MIIPAKQAIQEITDLMNEAMSANELQPYPTTKQYADALAEIEALKADNGHYRNMAVDFLRCREPYGWHCFTKDDDCLIMNVHGASKPDDSWATVIPLYLHSPRQEQNK